MKNLLQVFSGRWNDINIIFSFGGDSMLWMSSDTNIEIAYNDHPMDYLLDVGLTSPLLCQASGKMRSFPPTWWWVLNRRNSRKFLST
ncbi:hypothetical protein Ancab_036276 [Ancistrocladus abbreviatus]